jgi:Holliday junction DNA helicase RuvA
LISSLSGTLKAKSPNQIEVVVGGVGFRLLIPLSTYQILPEVSQPVSLLTHLHVKENAMDLLGFATPEERDLFELLITVSGVGPKLALTILSGIKVADLLDSIATEDKSLLGSVPGVGPKTAGRLVLELKEKVGKISTLAAVRDKTGVSKFDEAIMALEALGYTRYDAKRLVETAARDLGGKASTEEIIREALQATA